jgi:hypothetical protein
MDKLIGCAYLLKHEPIVRVYVNPGFAGVDIPDYLYSQAFVVLEIGLSMTCLITDLAIDQECLSGTLRFGSGFYTCVVPWGAVFGMGSVAGSGWTWPEAAPARAEVVKIEAVEGGGETTPPKRGHLRLCTNRDSTPPDRAA